MDYPSSFNRHHYPKYPNQVIETPSCSSEALINESGIQVTCVGSTAIEGTFFTTNIENLVAASSYLPLSGELGNGDGIIPENLAFMDSPANQVRVKTCSETGEFIRHANVLPTPWNLWDGNSASIQLPDYYRWYGSVGVVDQWVKYIV